MSDDAKKRGVDAADLHDNPPPPPYYGTFQGVANYYPPQNQSQSQSQSQPILGFPHPLPPPDPRYYYQGYNHALPVYAVAEGRPLREHRLRCCGLGLGWLLFITGFFLGGVPWYIGAFILLCIQMDYREKPGLIACTVASLIAVIAVTLGVTQRDHDR